MLDHRLARQFYVLDLVSRGTKITVLKTYQIVIANSEDHSDLNQSRLFGKATEEESWGHQTFNPRTQRVFVPTRDILLIVAVGLFLMIASPNVDEGVEAAQSSQSLE